MTNALRPAPAGGFPAVSDATAASPPPPTPRHFPGLDGVRGMAIALVLCSHTVIYGYAPSLVAAGLRSGAAGVTLFFVLSGYLITRLLIGEEAGTGQVSLPLFYARRALRLFPALWLYLTVISALWLAGLLPHHPWHSFVTSLLYVRNLVGRGHETDHLWSLSLEEQFYLMWPLAVVLLARHRQWRLPLALGIFLLVTAWRLYATAMGLASAGALYIRSDFAFDGPILGCALALAEARWAGHAERWRTGAWPAVAALTASAALALWIGAGSAALVRPALQNTLVAGLGIPLIWSQTGRAAVGWAGWRPLVYLGQISYGVYLWQQLFLGPPTPGFALVRIPPVGLLVTLTVAVSSYVLLETPMLRLKDRWRPRAA